MSWLSDAANAGIASAQAALNSDASNALNQGASPGVPTPTVNNPSSAPAGSVTKPTAGQSGTPQWLYWVLGALVVLLIFRMVK